MMANGTIGTKTTKAAKVTQYQRDLLEKRAADRLIAKKDCSKVKSEEFTHMCIGKDLNILDGCREWLFEEELAKGTEYERARIGANKLVLYVNESRLQRETERLISEVSAQ